MTATKKDVFQVIATLVCIAVVWIGFFWLKHMDQTDWGKHPSCDYLDVFAHPDRDCR